MEDLTILVTKENFRKEMFLISNSKTQREIDSAKPNDVMALKASIHISDFGGMIISVYKAKIYDRKCFDSILNETF
jgi:hypothetical protein